MLLINLLFGLLLGLLGATGPAAVSTSNDAASLKKSVALMAASIAEYSADNLGSLPPESLLQNCQFIRQAEDDPTSGASASCNYTYATKGPDAKNTILSHLGQQCDGTKSSRAYSVSTLLPDGKRYCLDG